MLRGSRWIHNRTGNVYVIDDPDARVKIKRKWREAVIYHPGVEKDYMTAQRYVRTRENFEERFTEDRS